MLPLSLLKLPAACAVPVVARSHQRSRAAAKLNDPAPIAFAGPMHRDGRKLLHRLALLGSLHTRLSASIRLAVELLCCRGRSAHLSQLQNFDLKLAAFVLHVEHVAY